jgi:hypothetical protein
MLSEIGRQDCITGGGQAVTQVGIYRGCLESK